MSLLSLNKCHSKTSLFRDFFFCQNCMLAYGNLKRNSKPPYHNKLISVFDTRQCRLAMFIQSNQLLVPYMNYYNKLINHS